MNAYPSDDSERLNFVPREVCVVMPAADDSDSSEWHERVRKDLNQKIATALDTVSVEGGDCFDRDLAPIALKQHYGSNANLLQPLGRPGDAANGIRLSGAGRDDLSVSCFRIGAHDPETASREREIDHRSVRELVNLINRHLSAASEGRSGNPPLFTAAPNWLTGATPHSCGGPAALPEAARTIGRPTIGFAHPKLAALVEHARASARQAVAPKPPVVVAVLDTSPSRTDVARAVERYPANALLREVYHHVSIDGPLALGDADFQHVRGIVVNWHDGPPSADHDLEAYRMPDHGLFSAGIIRDVAPAAEIHLIRALNDHGVGDVLALTKVLRALPDRLRTDPRQRLIVNLSLMADLPPRERLRPRWFPELCQDEDAFRQRAKEVEATFSGLARGLQDTIAWLNDQGVLVVAAAGNDALNLLARPEPRLPARFDDVFGVAAVDRRGEPSAFSNKGDEFILGNGVATFGGNARRLQPGEPARIESADDQPDALVGIFSGEQLPLNGGPNTTGLVYWAGTSFATPIVSAIAANVWASDPSLTPRELIRAVIHRYASPRNHELDCPIISARQQTE